MFSFGSIFGPIVSICAFGSLIVGSLGALVQKKIKRFVAYTSINQVGFLLIGFVSYSFVGL